MKDKDYSIRKLNRIEFADALRKGLGRAYLHVSRFGLDDISDLFLNACLHDQSWDPQVEGSRAKWLLSMFKNTSHYSEFASKIFEALQIETEYWDVQQLFELGKEMALAGDNTAKIAVKGRALEKAGKPSNDDELGSKEWMKIGGIEGAMELAKIYGERLLKNPEDFLPIDMVLIDMYTPEIRNAIVEKSQAEPSLKAYWDYLSRKRFFESVTQTQNGKYRSERFRKEYLLNRILKDAQNRKANFPGRYRAFGLYATEEELRVVYSRLLEEKSRAVRLRLLWVFRAALIPEVNDLFFKWANGRDGRIREATIAALARVKDDRVHELARRKTRAGELAGSDTEALSLFINNYGDGDANLITRALTSIRPNGEDAHNLVWSLVDVAERHKDKGLAEALRWGYETTPCSAHRYDVARRLDEIQQFEGGILDECRYDANEEIVVFARKKTIALNQ